MLENEMEDLIWTYPEKFLEEPLKPFRRQPGSAVGRADLVFEDRLGRLLVVEIKRGQLPRGAIGQIHDYFGMMKHEFPDKSVEMMFVAQSIPKERRKALDLYDIEYREISEKRFRDVALEMGYVFQSVQESAAGTSGTRDVVVLESDNTRTRGRPKEPAAESAISPGQPMLMDVVNAYNLTAEPDMSAHGEDPNYRQITPPGWKVSDLTYEFYQTKSRIGAELHLAFRKKPLKVESFTELLKPFVGRAVANGERKLEWYPKRHAGNGCLTAFFPLDSSPGTVAAAMRDLISMTRSAVSECLTSKHSGLVRTH